MITLSKEQIKRLHKMLLDSTGGLDGIRVLIGVQK